MTITCTKWRDLASEYIEGTLDEPMATAMAEHLHTCAVCRADAAALRALLQEMDSLPQVEPPPFFHENIMAAVERERQRHPVGPWWKTLLPEVTRAAVGTLVAGGAAAALFFALMIPRIENSTQPRVDAGPAMNLLPGTSAETGATSTARLRIARKTILLPDRGPTFDFTFWLENGARATARFDIAGVKESYRFSLDPGQVYTLQTPFDVAGENPTLDLRIRWTGDGAGHTRYIFLPLPRENGEEGEAPRERQAFTLPPADVVTVAREVAHRYRVPVTLDDVPENLRVQLVAREETGEETLRRTLAHSGLTVAVSRAGILVQKQNAPAPGTPAPRPTP